jgi:hypothetical protein
MKPTRDERHDMAVDLDGNPIPLAPGDVRKMITKLLDEGEILAYVVRRGDEVGVQVFGPPSMALVELLEQAVAGLRKATEGH